MDAQTISELQTQIQQHEGLIRQLRQQERSISAREQSLTSKPQVGGNDLERNLRSMLPSDHLMPGNVGGYNKVTWPFWHTVDFDMTASPTVSATTQQTKFFQVTQEAALLLLAVSRESSYDTAGVLGPWTIQIRDRQSSRQFNDRPIPLQMLGTRGKPTILPTAMLIMPNAFIDVTLGTWLTAPFTQALTGDAKHQIMFHGYRIRIEDTASVLSSVFQ